MKTTKDVNDLISDVTKEIESLKKLSNQPSSILKKEIKIKLDRLIFYRDIVTYLDTHPREEYLREQEAKLILRISSVDDKIYHLSGISKTPQALSNQIKSIKSELNYNKHKEQLEIIQFILNK
jgi:hypothetical protein